ncbi:MAG: hypothetical protein WDN31_11150 [Hyphomicrobium sp.]
MIPELYQRIGRRLAEIGVERQTGRIACSIFRPSPATTQMSPKESAARG